MQNVKGFNPMPNGVELRTSNIHGYGLFAVQTIKANHDLGVTHVADSRFQDGFIRTALGSYANHSNKPSIKGVRKDDTYHFVTIRQIEADEELLIDYADFNYDKDILKGYLQHVS
jgi:SET domain-containing protein